MGGTPFTSTVLSVATEGQGLKLGNGGEEGGARR